MAKQTIFIGQTANDRTGDPLRTAFVKVNSNFDELYARTSDDIQIPALAGNSGKVLTTNGTTLSWTTDSTTTSQLVNGANTVSLGSTGITTFPGVINAGNINNLVVNDLGGGTSLTAGSQVQIGNSAGIAGAGVLIKNAVTNTLGGETELESGSKIQMDNGIVSLSGYTYNSAGGGDGLEFQMVVEVENNYPNKVVRIGTRIINTIEELTTNVFQGITINQYGVLTLPGTGTIDNSIDTNSNQSIELTPNNLSQTTATIIVDKNGPPNAQWATVQVGWTITVGLVTRTINSITDGPTTVSFVLNGTVALPMTGSVIFQSLGTPSLAITPNGTTTWTFNSDGTLDLPNTGSIQQKFVETKVTQSNIILNASSGVIWTANNPYASGVKLIIQAEIDETGDATGWHSQVCEAIVASRGYASSASGPLGDPQMTVYGITYTSTEPLITFTVQRDPITNLIEVTGTRTATALSSARVDFRIHSVEMSTSD